MCGFKIESPYLKLNFEKESFLIGLYDALKKFTGKKFKNLKI